MKPLNPIPFALLTLFSVLFEAGAAQPGDVDLTFDPGSGISSGGTINSLALQPDGKVVIGGYFSAGNGIARMSIARLNPDGALDTSFLNGLSGAGVFVNPPGTTVPGHVNSVAVQANGQVVIGGDFTRVNGMGCTNIARLNPDGSLDTNFQSGSVTSPGQVYSVGVQSDSKVFVGGSFTSGGPGIIRLNSDGSLDTGFHATWGGATPPTIRSLAVQSDGKVIIGGNFGLFRLGLNGLSDTNFQQHIFGELSGLIVVSVGLQTDGKVLMGGNFGISSNGSIARLNANGSPDNSFQPTKLSGVLGNIGLVKSFALQPDGKVLIGGSFSALGGVTRNGIARLNANGSLDTSFQDGMDGVTNVSSGPGSVNSLAVQSDGKVLIGGGFYSVNGVARNGIARLYGIAPLFLGNFGVVANQFGFNISGESNQVIVVEGSTDLVNWTPLTTNILGAGPSPFTDPTSATFQKRFYRARLQ